MPSVHGTRFNGLPLDDRATTFMQSLADAGYRTGLIGKLHLQNMGDHPEIAAAVVDRTLRNDAVSMPPTGWDSWELSTLRRPKRRTRHRAGLVRVRTCRACD